MSARKSQTVIAEALTHAAEGDVGVALMRTAFVMRQSLQRELALHEPRLSPAELAILHMLSMADGQRVGDLADAALRDRTTLPRIADRMVDKDLIERRPDPDDRRAVRLWITATGRKLHRRLLPIRHALVERATGHLADNERQVVIRALVSVRERLLADQGED